MGEFQLGKRGRMGVDRWVPLLLGLGSCVPDVERAPDTEPGVEEVAWSLPENEWPSERPPTGLIGEGFAEGQVVPDLRLPDQHDHTVATWQFYGEVVLVTIGAVWCSPCRDLAVEAGPLIDSVGGDVLHVTVLVEDGGGLDADVDDAAAWAAAYGDESPVLADPERLFEPALGGAFPTVLVLDRGLVVTASVAGPTTDQLRDLLAAAR